MTNFCHISPTKYLDNFKGRPVHLVLAHLVETDEEYTKFYAAESKNSTIILDNSAFEMYKQGRPMYPSEKLIEMGEKVNADYIVMSDYPGQTGIKTIEAAEKMGPELRAAGFKTFFVPQAEIGDIEDLLNGFRWASLSEHVDYIGISILAVPNAYGVERDNKLQRFMARWKFMRELLDHGILMDIKLNGKKIHFLGMVDGPNEIDLVSHYLPFIDTWDSSAGVWAGINDIAFDNSPTGLVNGKLETEVDFSHEIADNGQIELALDNCKFIDCKLERLESV